MIKYHVITCCHDDEGLEEYLTSLSERYIIHHVLHIKGDGTRVNPHIYKIIYEHKEITT